MKVITRVKFCAKRSERVTIDELIRSHGGTRLPFGRQDEGESIMYEAEMRYHRTAFEILRDQLEKLGVQNLTHAYSFYFEDQDYEQAPLFWLSGLGNTPEAYVEDQGAAEFEVEVVCGHCNLHRKKPLSPLVIDTSVLVERYMVVVDGQFLVASESLVKLLEQSNLTGYTLEPVLHHGDEEDRQPAYHLIPNHVLPAWSDQTPYLEIKGRRTCPACNLRGHVYYPLYYNQDDLTGRMQDFNLTQEYIEDGHLLKRLPLVSARFRQLMIEHGITEDVRSDASYDEMDWMFTPVILSKQQ